MKRTTSGIVLAAGYSSRAGMYKMTCPIKGTTLIERCIGGMLRICDEIIVVGGYRFEHLSFLSAKFEKVRLVFNEDYDKGMFLSVRKGLLVASGTQAFITPGDMPMISGNTYDSMARCEGDIIVPSCRGMQGHPVLMRRKAIRLLLSGEPGTLRDFIHTYGNIEMDVDDPGILVDLDTWDDYLSILRKSGGMHDTYCNGACK